MSAKAPEGFYTNVIVDIGLANDRNHIYRWNTPMALAPALHKSLGWAKREMQKEGRAGRSKIVEVRISARLVKGGYAE